MKILVCFKAVPNWDKVLDRDWDNFSPETDIKYAGTDFNCFDEAALELALRLKSASQEEGEETTLSALTVARSLSGPLTETLYAAGFDEVTLINDNSPEFDPGHVASLLAEYAAEGEFDLILTGLQAGMADTGLVPGLLSEKLRLPYVCDVLDIALCKTGIQVRQQDRQGLWQRDYALPALVSVGNSPAVLRAVNLRARMAAKGRKSASFQGHGGRSLLLEPGALSRPDNARELSLLPEADIKETAKALLRELSPEDGGAAASESVIKPPSSVYMVTCDENLSLERLSVVLGAITPDVILLRDNARGRALASALSIKTGANLLTGAKLLGFERGGVRVRKRVCSANLNWERTLSFPVVLTTTEALPEGAITLAEQRSPDSLKQRKSPPPAALEMQPEAQALAEQLIAPPVETGLSNPGCVVICGAGAGTREVCDRARLLAKKLNAGFGLTRLAAINGMGSSEEIVGMSGSIISPRACLVLGASGAGAFLAGIETAGKICCVNTDPKALIFKSSNIGAVADAASLIEAMLELLA